MHALWSLFSFILAVGILVSFHEFGHYSIARLCGVKVLRFSIGFGKSIKTYQKTSESTEWSLSALPLGGYVKMDEESFRSKKLWQRSIIVAAGPLANFLLAIFLLSILFISGVQQLPSKLAEPSPNTLAYELGVYSGDVVTAWKSEDDQDFRSIISWNQLRWRLIDAVTAHKGFSLELKTSDGNTQVIVFNKEKINKPSPNIDPIANLGIKPDISEPIGWFELQLKPIQAVSTSFERVLDISTISLRMIAGIFTGEASIRQIGGPLSIADMAGRSAQVGWQSYLGFLALISISLAILNLLPLPMLDGGQLLYDAWELVSGHKVPQAIQEVLQRFGVASLLFLTMLALFNDISRLFLR
jgi:regulator of sigma E protease